MDEFDELYKSDYRRFVMLAYSVSRDLPISEDITQDCFVDLLRHWDRVHAPEAWLRKAVVHRAISAAEKQRKVVPVAEMSEVLSYHEDPDATELRMLLNGLTPRQRAAVTLRYFFDLSEREIADALDCRPGTVKSLLSRALDRLRLEVRDVGRV